MDATRAVGFRCLRFTLWHLPDKQEKWRKGGNLGEVVKMRIVKGGVGVGNWGVVAVEIGEVVIVAAVE